jgi:hypothetical protein
MLEGRRGRCRRANCRELRLRLDAVLNRLGSAFFQVRRLALAGDARCHVTQLVGKKGLSGRR